jgi:hypothetical protein
MDTTKTNRVQNWPAVLGDMIHLRMHAPFAWGSQDCCLFASDVIKSITGIDPAESLRGKYTTAAGAKRVIARHGKSVEKLAEKFCAKHGWAEVPVVRASRGDLVLFDTADHGPSVGICVGATAAFAGPAGLTFQSLTSCRRAWRI